MNKSSLITTTLIAALTFSAVSVAKDASKPEEKKAISAMSALNTAKQLHPAEYTSIDLVVGKNERAMYIAEGEQQGKEVITIIDAASGKDLTAKYKSTKFNLMQAIDIASQSFSGKVVSASKEFNPDLEAVYTIVIENDSSEQIIVFLNANTLKILDVESYDESRKFNEMEGDFDDEYFEMVGMS